ncbi:MAG: aspartate aminotransferase family protein [Clostridiales bacterium]|nr:aspartate aminotransferase family protein [Clostridiales bacterium]
MTQIYDQDKTYVLNLYNRLNINIVNGEGSYLYDDQGNSYLDMFSGIAVNNLGHGNPAVKAAVIKQMDCYFHLSNFFPSEPVASLAKVLVENSFASKVFFSNSGTEANEAAIKLARKYGRSKQIDKTEMLSFHGSFHGRTVGGMTLTGQEKYKENFKPILPGVSHVLFNDCQDLASKVSDKTCAFFIEMIQGEGGITEVSEEFMTELVELSKKHDFLIIVDEIQTGLGRAGDLFAYEKFEFTPHIVTLAKSLGGGLPIGAMLVAPELESVLLPGDHGSTFGGNPVAAAAGTAVLDILTSNGFLDDVKNKSIYLIKRLEEIALAHPEIIREVRGRGLIIGIEMYDDLANKVKAESLAKGLLLNVTRGNVIRLLPPLTISYTEMDLFLSIFESLL